ncbi:hypothetical protein ACFW21_02640 [Streptomyces albogriseolus]|uniref:hypothetical protein n=1 Tax=Streptomyces albogriseolus TaxID=1887 RepID=UPI00367C2DE6
MTSSAPSPDDLPVYDRLVRERGDVVAEVREVAERTQFEVRQALAGTVRPRPPQTGPRQQQGPGGPRHPQTGPRQPQGGPRQQQGPGLPQGQGPGPAQGQGQAQAQGPEHAHGQPHGPGAGEAHGGQRPPQGLGLSQRPGQPQGAGPQGPGPRPQEGQDGPRQDGAGSQEEPRRPDGD